MTLEEYLVYMRSELMKFEIWYKTQQRIFPQQFPAVNDKHVWVEYIADMITEETQDKE